MVGCPLCDREVVWRFSTRGYDIHRCHWCDLEFVHPLPSEETLRAVYASGYFSGSGPGYTDYFGTERALCDRKARARIDQLIALGASPGGTVLDVGCADGRFLLAARARGFQVRGVEISPEARAEIPFELTDVIDTSLERACAHGPYDLVTLWDVLEHLSDPFGTLQTIRGALAPGALVGLVVPVIDNANARVWPRSWDQYKPPEHLWFFSRRALRMVLERHLGGTVVYEAPAWRREARLFQVACPVRGVLGRVASKLEGTLWRRLCAAGLIDPEHLEDSVLVIARAGGHC